MNNTNNTTNNTKDKRWDLLDGVKKGLEELYTESNNHSEIKR
jgi:hypothetical protein